MNYNQRSSLYPGNIVETDNYKYLLLKQLDRGIWECLNLNTGKVGKWYTSFLQENGDIWRDKQ
jgi:hypothetical protein